MGFHTETSFAEDGHGHTHPAPHGGQVQELGDYHVEFAVSEHGAITVYLSDHLQKPLSVKDVQGIINLKVGSGFKRLNLKPNANATALEGEIDLHEIQEFEAGVRLTINGKKYSNVVFKHASHEAMPRKTLDALFPTAHKFVPFHATLHTGQIETIEKALAGYDTPNAEIGTKKQSIHVMIAEDAAHKIIGSAVPFQRVGPNQDKIRGLVGINTDGVVISVVLMEHHHEDDHDEHGEHGEHHHEDDHDEHGEHHEHHDVEHTTFLKQFVGKTATNDLRIGKEIQAEAEMEEKAAIATGVKKALLVWNAVKNHLEDLGPTHDHDH